MLHRTRRAVLAASILASITLTVWVGVSVARFVSDGWWLAVLIALPLGVATIDLLSGVVHWACDRFGDAATPVLGPLLIRAFRDHHVDPKQMVERDWVETNGELFLHACPGDAGMLGAQRSVRARRRCRDHRLDDGRRGVLGQSGSQMGAHVARAEAGANSSARRSRFAPGGARVPSSGTPRFRVLHQHGLDEPALGSHRTLALARTLA